jgi:hypothetical protein
VTLDQRQQNIRNYIPGSGLIKLRRGIKQGVNDDRFLVNVPKNASSYLYSWTTYHEWQVAKAEDMFQTKELVAVLRNPLDRWISGFSQYITSYILNVYGPNGPLYPGIDEPTEHDNAWSGDDFVSMYNPLVERLIFDVISRFDDHTWPQWEILQGLPQCQHTWFYLDHNFEDRFSQYMGWPILNNLDYNRGTDNPDVDKLQYFFNQRLRARPELKNRVKEHYAKDYELIRKVIQ